MWEEDNAEKDRIQEQMIEKVLCEIGMQGRSHWSDDILANI